MSDGVKVRHQVTINRAPEDVYAFWRNFENLPQFMWHLKDVRVQDETRSHWVAKAPLDQQVEWDAEIVVDQPNQVLVWRSLEGADVSNRGQVRFKPAPGERGTEVYVELEYDAPAGAFGALLARIAGEAPDQQVREDLRRFKQILEAGEIPSITGQPHGERSLLGKVAARIEGEAQ